MSEVLLRVKQVSKIVGLSRSTVYAKMKLGQFPKAFKLSEKAIAWKASDIQNWIDTRVAA